MLVEANEMTADRSKETRLDGLCRLYLGTRAKLEAVVRSLEETLFTSMQVASGWRINVTQMILMS